MLNATPKTDQRKTRLGPRYISWALLVVATIGVVWALALNSPTYEPIVVVDDQAIPVVVAESVVDQQRGLSGRDRLEQGTGMLFVFPKEDIHCFWMKDMNFPIDMVWFGKDRRVIDVASNVQPDSFPKNFCPSGEARYVLELNAGEAASFGLRQGTPVQLRY
jgi:uncharacterized protein